MDHFITFLLRIVAILLVALVGWWVFPDELADLSYGQWVSVAVVIFFALGMERASDDT